MKKPTVCFDFDGVIHKYRNGWQEGKIYDEPNQDVKEAIDDLKKDYTIIILTSRINMEDVKEYLTKNDIYFDDVTNIKPPALVYVDDRGINYDVSENNLAYQVRNFKTGLEKRKVYENKNYLELLFIFRNLVNEFTELSQKFNLKVSVVGINDDEIIIQKMIAAIRNQEEVNNLLRKYL